MLQIHQAYSIYRNDMQRIKSNLFIIFTTVILLCISSSLIAQHALIPFVKIAHHEGALSLSDGLVVNRNNPSLDLEYQVIDAILQEWGVIESKNTHSPTLKLQIRDIACAKEGAYELSIDKTGITIQAKNAAGIFYGLQTLRQLSLKDKEIGFCAIYDQPAFPWRAFLVDVGRNCQPLDMLKEQIDVMARYKLNVLHFHFTEDIAWRLVSKKYPGLTDASNMTRWKGDFYTEEQFRELIQYCADRHILLLPEIDMPGHSAAFERYFGVNMQSDSGMVYIKELLKEFATTYPGLPYLHIGGDEVKITNKDFMPEITRYVEQLGYKTIGWDPGSNLMRQTIRQLWMGGPTPILEQGELVFIDSKHLYINHMDPLETVTTLFHRRIGEQDKAHQNLIGATLCAWPDRAVAHPRDMFYQNAVYPALVTFSERVWQGGGKVGWVSNILPKDTKEYHDFNAFEERLLLHKDRYFADKPFPYVKQTDLHWELIGPFDNSGDLSQSFPIENNPDAEETKVAKKVAGGTIILRHWWADIIQGAINNPQSNTTWYARTKIWSDKEETKECWIGFDNFSRSYASDSPLPGTWDNRGSEVWVNGVAIPPPNWKQGGMKGHLEKPLLDEGYSFREPTIITLKKGWNTVLVKLPVGIFKGKDWQNPVKWMFTFAPLANP